MLALATVAGLALAPSSTPGGNEVLARAFAGGERGDPLLARAHDEPGLGAWTDDVWMHVRADGTIDRVRELRLDGEYEGMESVIEQPYGIGDLRDAVTRTRAGADRPIRTGKGIGIAEFGFTEVIAAAEQAARGARAVGASARGRLRGPRRRTRSVIRAARSGPRGARAAQRALGHAVARARRAAARWRCAGARARSAGAPPTC